MTILYVRTLTQHHTYIERDWYVNCEVVFVCLLATPSFPEHSCFVVVVVVVVVQVPGVRRILKGTLGDRTGAGYFFTIFLLFTRTKFLFIVFCSLGRNPIYFFQYIYFVVGEKRLVFWGDIFLQLGWRKWMDHSSWLRWSTKYSE